MYGCGRTTRRRILGYIERLAGNFTAAEAISRDCCAAFEQARDQAALSSLSSELGQSLYAPGPTDRSPRGGTSCGGIRAARHVPAQFAWRASEGELLRPRGSSAGRTRHSHSKQSASRTPPTPHASARMCFSIWPSQPALGSTGRCGTGSRARRSSLRHEGDVVSAVRARSLLDEIAVSLTTTKSPESGPFVSGRACSQAASIRAAAAAVVGRMDGLRAVHAAELCGRSDHHDHRHQAPRGRQDLGEHGGHLLSPPRSAALKRRSHRRLTGR